jgi:hypothetical protein
MERNRVIRFVLFLIAALLATGAIAAQRTFVKSDGVDPGRPCSLPLPCRTFGAAMLLTDFGGDIVTLDTAGYGPVTITQPVSILVPSGIYAGVSPAGVDGIVIDIANGGGPVFLRGLQINGSQGGTNGVRINRGGRVILESVSISNFYNSGNGHAILDNSTSPYTELVLRNVVIRDGASGVVVDGTAGNKSVSIENSLISGFGNTACVSLTDSVNMVVSNTTVEDCNTGFALTQPGSSFGYMQLQMERTTLTRIGPNPAVKIVNNANDRAPNVAISDSHLSSASGITVTNSGNVAIDRSTFDGCGTGPGSACIDVGGTSGFRISRSPRPRFGMPTVASGWRWAARWEATSFWPTRAFRTSILTKRFTLAEARVASTWWRRETRSTATRKASSSAPMLARN